MRTLLLLCFMLVPISSAAALPAALLSQLEATPELQLARDRLALARLQASQDAAWQITLVGDTGLSGEGNTTAFNATSSLNLSHKGRRALDDVRLGRVLALKRAEFALRRAALSELRRRAGVWHAASGAQAAALSAELSLKAAQLDLKTAEARATAGSANALSVDTARLALSRAELTQTQAAQTLSQARLDLAALNLDMDTPASSWSPLSIPPLTYAGPREDLLEAQLTITETQNALEREQQAARPTLQAVGGLSAGAVNVTADLDRFGNVNVSTGARWPQTLSSGRAPTGVNWSLGLRGSVRLDGAAQNVVQQAQQTLNQAVLTAKSTLTRAERDRTLKRQAWQSASQTLTLIQAQRAAAISAAQVAQERFDKGLIAAGDLTGARLEAARSEESLSAAQKTLDNAALDLWEAVGWFPFPLASHSLTP